MEPNHTYEQEIDLKDLMFAVLHRWRTVVLAAAVLAVVLGGYRAVSVYRGGGDAETAQKDYQMAVELYETNLANCEREIDNLTESIEAQQKYLEESRLMNMDPYKVWVAQTVLFVKTDYQIMPDMMYQNLDYTNTILAAYGVAIADSEFLQKIAEKAGMDEQYLKELISTEVSGNLLTIKVKDDTENGAKTIMNAILEGLGDAQKLIRTSIGSHTVSEISSDVSSPRLDQELQDMQKTQSDYMATLNASLRSKQDELNALEEPAEVSSSLAEVLKSGVRYAVLGGVLGAFLVVFCVCVAFLMSDKVYSAKELKNRCRVKVLGSLPLSEKKPAAFDAWLRKLEGRAGGADESVEYGLIAANIANYAGAAKTLMVAGTADVKLISALESGLKSRLTGVKLIHGGNLLRDGQSLRQLPDCDGVVLVEQCSRSAYGDVMQEIENVKDLQKAIVGCVVFE